MAKQANETAAQNNFWIKHFSTYDDDIEENKIYEAVYAIGIGTNLAGTAANNRSLAVALKAAELYTSGRVRRVVLVGGNGKNPKTGEGIFEADAMFQEIVGIVPRERIILERTSTDTVDNAIQSLSIARMEGWYSTIAVADALHAGRVRRTFRTQWRKKKTNRTCIVVKAYGMDDNDSGGTFVRPFPFLAYNACVSTGAYVLGWAR